MNSQNQSAQNPAADRRALAAAQTQLGELAETFKFFITTNRADITLVDCSIVIEEAEKLIEALQTLKQALKDRKNDPQPHTDQQTKNSSGIKENWPRRVSLDDVIRQQSLERGLTPLPLEVDLLLKRVTDGGYSGQFLADAFISAYRTDMSFPHSLGGLIKLDAEAFRLFHECLHVRHISGWNDDKLYAIEQQINAIVGGAA